MRQTRDLARVGWGEARCREGLCKKPIPVVRARCVCNRLTRLYSHTLTHRIVTASECEIGLAAGG